MTITHNLPKLRCSIGVTAHNEEQNIGKCLRALQNQLLREVEITEIMVVASGCTDRTHEIVEEIAATDERIKLIVQKKVGYAFDLDLSDLSDQHSGTHEIMVGLDIPTNKLQNVASPRFF